MTFFQKSVTIRLYLKFWKKNNPFFGKNKKKVSLYFCVLSSIIPLPMSQVNRFKQVELFSVKLLLSSAHKKKSDVLKSC